MLDWQRIKKEPALFKRLTGVSLQTFEQMLGVLEPAYPEFLRQRLSRADRQRAIGAGGKFKLSLEGLVLMTLFFLRHYPTYAVLGVLFGLHESNAYRDVQMMQAFLSAYFPLPERVRQTKLRSVAQLLVEEPQLEVLIDATEQGRSRPKDREGRARFYSGKKKRHTIKSQVVVERSDGLIIDVSSGWEGRRHDLKVFEASGVRERLGGVEVVAWLDKGYAGIEALVDGWQVLRPTKKARGKGLSVAQREQNRAIGRVRVLVEHKILAMKRYLAFGGLYRGRGKGYGQMVSLIAGLVNLEVLVRGGRLKG